jgi:hypothetical protein
MSEAIRAVPDASDVPGQDLVAQARRRLDDLRAQRVIAELTTPTEELATVELQVSDELSLQAAIKEHGKLGQRVHAIYTPLGIVIVKRPTRAAYREYQASDNRYEGQDVLVHACLVHPDHTRYERIVDEYPAIQSQLAGAIALLAGIQLEITASKS